MDLFLSLRDPRRLQPLRRRLDGRAPGKRGTGQAVYRGDHRQALGSRRATHPPCRPRQGHDFQTGRLLDGRPGRHQDPQPALSFRRQAVFGKPVPHHEVPPGVPGSLRLHPRQPRLLPAVFPVVQPRASPLRHRLADPGHGSLWGDPDCPGPPPGGAQRRLPSAPGPLRSAAAKTTATTIGGLDQQAGATRPTDRRRKSVNSYAWCLKVLDTRSASLRSAAGKTVGEAEEIPLFFTLIPVLALLSNYDQENCLINVGTEGAAPWRPHLQRMAQVQPKMRLQSVPDRPPILSRRFHHDFLPPLLLQPSRQMLDLTPGCAELPFLVFDLSVLLRRTTTASIFLCTSIPATQR